MFGNGLTQKQFLKLSDVIGSWLYNSLTDSVPDSLPPSASLPGFRRTASLYLLWVGFTTGWLDLSRDSDRWIVRYLVCHLLAFSDSWSWLCDSNMDVFVAWVLRQSKPNDCLSVLEEHMSGRLGDGHMASVVVPVLARRGAFSTIVSAVQERIESGILDLARYTRKVDYLSSSHPLCRRINAIERWTDLLMRTAPFAPDECSLEELAKRCKRCLVGTFVELYLDRKRLRFSTVEESVGLRLLALYAARMIGFESLEVILSLLEALPDERFRLLDEYICLNGMREDRRKRLLRLFDYHLLTFLRHLVDRIVSSSRLQKIHRYADLDEEGIALAVRSGFLSPRTVERFPRKEEEMRCMDMSHYVDILRRLMYVCDQFDELGYVRYHLLDFVLSDLDGRWSEDGGFSHVKNISSVLWSSYQFRNFLEKELFPVLERWMEEEESKSKRGKGVANGGKEDSEGPACGIVASMTRRDFIREFPWFVDRIIEAYNSSENRALRLRVSALWRTRESELGSLVI